MVTTSARAAVRTGVAGQHRARERRAALMLAEGQHAHDQRNPQQHLGVCEPGEREERGGQDDAAQYAS